MTDKMASSVSTAYEVSDALISDVPLAPVSSMALLRFVTRDRVNQTVFLITTLGVMLLYSLLLPFEYTQRFSFANWHYLDVQLIAWAVVLSIGMASVIVLQIYSMRQIVASKTLTGAVGGLAFIGSVMPSLLCCTPIIPTVLAFVGFSTVSVYGTTGTLQHFFATNQTEFFVGSLFIMVLTAYWSIRRVKKSACLAGNCYVKELTSSSYDVFPDTRELQ